MKKSSEPLSDIDLTHKGFQYYRMGEFEEAIEAADQAIRLNPQNAEA
ncbi:tetratricopeptide repeat protein [Methanospirillum purgamenti]|jgi:tetratricopeptide (TPR) repeat protein|uniref:Tetratricopeptide repeat protein n=1 Tax=Methanospirillum hungatei TaxID=2203 RepID=A0A8F5VPA6_METHU|nr:tetratricopeptide repeat protein [Methanospirillum hungatei]QXO95906.1 tetratricopeptide repeat protein [Methanospirillum hungatei]